MKDERVQHKHQGHRDRLRERFYHEGLSHFAPHEVLEYLLYSVYKQGDTNQIAHELIDSFGSFSAVLEADPKDLMKTKGVGLTAALQINFIAQATRYYLDDKYKDGYIADTTEKLGNFLLPKFVSYKQEVVFAVCLDSKHKVINCQKLFSGTINATMVSIRTIAEYALRNNAVSIVIAHNHPGATALPSNEDIITTRKIVRALEPLNIRVRDHIIVSDNDYVSLADSGEFSKFLTQR